MYRVDELVWSFQILIMPTPPLNAFKDFRFLRFQSSAESLINIMLLTCLEGIRLRLRDMHYVKFEGAIFD